MITESFIYDLQKLIESYEYNTSKEAIMWIDTGLGTVPVRKKHPTFWSVNDCLEQAGKLFFKMTEQNKKMRQRLRQHASGNATGTKNEQVEYFLSMIMYAAKASK